MPRLALTSRDEAMLAGRGGPAVRTAMEVLVAMARASGAGRLIDVTSAHIDGCLYHGRASLDFAERLENEGARVAVPATLNVGSLDLLHPDLYRGDPGTARDARRLMDLYLAMGCRPTWTCAPYQLEQRPGFGEHVAWAESNAIVFANSVLGARTDRYGDFIDICAALTGRVPDAGLHRAEHRRGEMVFRLEGIPERLLRHDVLYPVLGHLVGSVAGTRVPVIVGLPESAAEDRLKALGAAAASSGSVGLFHAVGVTPEAPTLDDALQGRPALREIAVTPTALKAARASLDTVGAGDGRLVAVSIGTPHLSVEEFGILTPLVQDLRVHPEVEFYVSTGRDVLAEVEARGWLEAYGRAGIRLVVDTCTYVTPVIRASSGVAMTNSAKWAYYAPGNIGLSVAFGTLEECIRSAELGRVWRDESLWDSH